MSATNVQPPDHTTSHITWAESINPPKDDPDFQRRQAVERERLRKLADAVEPLRLSVLDDVPMPEVPKRNSGSWPA